MFSDSIVIAAFVVAVGGVCLSGVYVIAVCIEMLRDMRERKGS